MNIIETIKYILFSKNLIRYPQNTGEMDKDIYTVNSVRMMIFKHYGSDLHMKYSISLDLVFDALIESGHIEFRSGFLNDYCKISKNFKKVLSQFEVYESL